jgi:hypothetical protein
MRTETDKMLPQSKAAVTGRWVGHDALEMPTRRPDADLRAAAVPVCLAGKVACPPEDCGGAWGYTELKETIADPSDEGHEEMPEWVGLEDLSDFDPAAFD